jgi:hypothetical protein
MAERPGLTDIYLVSDLAAALDVARQLEAEAVGLDMEGVLGNYVGNEPYDGSFDDFMSGQGEANMALAHTQVHESDVAFGIVTNNANKPDARNVRDGLVTRVAGILGVPFVNKGMQVGETTLQGKPSGDLSRRFCEEAGVDPRRAVLIDDQGVKNAGDAVHAGMRAIIVPDPIGLPSGRFGGVKEHMGVEFGRLLEPAIYRSLARQGWLANLAYQRLAGIDPRRIGELHDLKGT